MERKKLEKAFERERWRIDSSSNEWMLRSKPREKDVIFMRP